jgi:hypothetical protein
VSDGLSDEDVRRIEHPEEFTDAPASDDGDGSEEPEAA